MPNTPPYGYYSYGRRIGQREGYKAGYNSGYRSGYSSGYEKGLNEGYSKGYQEGYSKGYTEGYKKHESEVKQIINTQINKLLYEDILDENVVLEILDKVFSIGGVSGDKLTIALHVLTLLLEGDIYGAKVLREVAQLWDII
ncbi:FliH/SctL family protein [Pyrococcus kukulkanii]|uniref:Essential protein Yae1 N-terminal domain-containing protein n=1 Tax=Pyrococcus kukulkanii TaxID=1609559 RepID=A0A127B9H4_9EURY|nr:hypothetical protein [Pyrococcus kukulkanii]AMM54020.1 hypothetical protein TQ32_05675 [Pyrococcus kukulkanii]